MLVHKTEREEVKNDSVTDQSQYWGAELLSLESKGCHQSHDTHTGPSSRTTILTQSRLKSLWLQGTLSVDEETTTCGWGEVCVCLCIREGGKRSKMNS